MPELQVQDNRAKKEQLLEERRKDAQTITTTAHEIDFYGQPSEEKLKAMKEKGSLAMSFGELLEYAEEKEFLDKLTPIEVAEYGNVRKNIGELNRQPKLTQDNKEKSELQESLQKLAEKARKVIVFNDFAREKIICYGARISGIAKNNQLVNEVYNSLKNAEIRYKNDYSEKRSIFREIIKEKSKDLGKLKQELIEELKAKGKWDEAKAKEEEEQIEHNLKRVLEILSE